MSQTATRDLAPATLPTPTLPTSARLRAVLRPVLMLGGVVLAVIAAVFYWLAHGGTVGIDDATIGAAKLDVATDISGIVATVAVHEGQTVRRGDVLLTLDDRPFRIAVAGAQAALDQSALDVAAMKQDYLRALRDAAVAEAQVAADRTDYGRLAGLADTGAVTRSETDDARFKLAADSERLNALHGQANVQLARLSGNAAIDPAQTPAWQQARARLDEAQRQLAHTVIRAPFDGIATQVETVQPGLYLAAATPALALVSTDDVWAEGYPKETELTWVVPGDHVDVAVDTYPGQHWDGVVESISPASGAEFSVLPAQNTSGNWVKVVQRIPLRVRLNPRRDAPRLRAGMSVLLTVDTGRKRHLADLLP